MKIMEIVTRRHADQMDTQTRHGWLEFIYLWLAGTYMGAEQPPEALQRWRELARMFPPRVPQAVRLYRLVTVPLQMAEQPTITFRPAPNMVASWTSTLVGLDAVAGIAREQTETPNSARVGIQAELPGAAVLATALTIRDAFITLSHDYFERYPETSTQTKRGGQTYVSYENPGFPGTNPNFTMDDVGFLQDVLNRPGGHYRQYECVVQTPAEVTARIVRIYRKGEQTFRIGNDDPHQWNFKRRKNVWR